MQLRASLVVFRALAAFMKDVAKDATEELGALGKVWSETRLNRREAMTRMSVATFSGASYNARRTRTGIQIVSCTTNLCTPKHTVVV